MFGSDRPYEIWWDTSYGRADIDVVTDVRVWPHPGEGPGHLGMSAGHSGSINADTPPEAERRWLMAMALHLVFEGVPPAAVLREFWQIEQWHHVTLPMIGGGCLFLEGGQWSPHNCDDPDEHRAELFQLGVTAAR